MQKRRLSIFGVLAVVFIITIGLFQNCGVVSVAPMDAPATKAECDDSQEYDLYTPVEPAILQLQRYRNGQNEYFQGSNLRWWIDNVETNVLPEVPNCERRYDVRVIYNDQCGLEHMQEFQFADPRCEPTTTTTTTSSTTTTVRAPAPDQGDKCAALKADPANVKFQPAGFTEIRKVWGDTFFRLQYGNNINEIFKVPLDYASTSGNLVPIGSYTLASFRRSLGQIIVRQQPMTGKYITTSFVPTPGVIRQIKGLGQQTLGMGNHSQHSMQPYNPDSVYVTISECPGDFRVATASEQPANDHTMSRRCRYEWHSEVGIIRYATHRGDGTICRLEEGKTYYLNFIFQPKDGVFNPARTTCAFDDIEYAIESLRSWGVTGSDESLRRIAEGYQYRCNYNMKHQ